MKLNEELKKFWDWAGITSAQYENNSYEPTTATSWMQEWEDEYPNYNNLVAAFKHDLQIWRKDKSLFKDIDVVKLFVFAVAIDNEGENLADYIVSNLDSIDMDVIFDKSLESKLINAQWLLASRVLHSDSQKKVHYLLRFLNEGGDDYVKERAKYALDSLGIKY